MPPNSLFSRFIFSNSKTLIKPLSSLSSSSLSSPSSSTSSSSSSSSSPTPFLPPPPSPSSPIRADPAATTSIVSSFRNWFKASPYPVFDHIFHLLNSSDSDPDLAFSHLGLRLSESLVLNLLNYKRNDVLSCIKLFDWAGRQPGFTHTRTTFIALFKILSEAKLTTLMLDLLDAYGVDQLWQKFSLNEVLVMGYAMAGRVVFALQIFGKMRFKGVDLNDVSYHVLLNALVEERCYDAVSVVMNQIRLRGFENQVTYAIYIKCLCSQDRADEAEEYLRGLVRDKRRLSGHALAHLVDALCNKDMFHRAADLIHEFGDTGVVPMEYAYDVWIRYLVNVGKLDDAMEFFKSKKTLEGYIPDVFRFNFLIQRLLRNNRLKEACDMLMDMKESRIVPDKVTMNVALCFFCKAGMMDVVYELYKLKSDFGLTPSNLVYNYIINNLCGDGGTDEAYRVLKNAMIQGYFPGRKTFSILADALCREGKLDKMKDLVMFALEHNFMPAESTYDKFIRALCRAKRVEDGYLIHSELNRLNRRTSDTTYSYLIQGFSRASRGDIAARLLIEMQEKGYKPSQSLFRAVIRCLCEMDNPDKQFFQLLEMQLSRYGPTTVVFNFFIEGSGLAKRPDLARKVYEMMGEIGVGSNLDSDIILLRAYFKSGRIADAVNLFEDIGKKRKLGRKMYNCMVVGLCKVGKGDFALAMLRQALSDGVVPNLECYEELVKMYCSEKKYDDAIKVINEMEKSGRKISSFIGNVLLLHSLQSKDLYNAWVRSRETSDETPSSSLLGQLIAAFSGQIRMDCQVEDLEEAIQKCFPLDLYSYNMLLRKLSINQIDGACQLFSLLCRKGYEPNRWSYDILVNGLFRHGRLTEAKIWAKEMVRQGHSPTQRAKLLV